MPSVSVKNGARKAVHAALHISKVEGLSGSLYCKVVLIRSQRSFITSASSDGTWNSSFSFVYDGEEEAHLEVIEKGWFGWEYAVGGTSIVLNHVQNDQQSSYRLALEGSTASLLVEVNQRVTSTRAFSDFGLDHHDIGDNALMGYIQKKLDFHTTSLACITEHGLNDGADEDVKSIMDELESSLRECNQQSCIAPYSDGLDSTLTSSRGAQVSQEINFWNTLFKMSQTQNSHSHPSEQSTHVGTISPTVPIPPIATLPLPADVTILYEERLHSLQRELEVEKSMVQLLRTRNAELELEVKQKNDDLSHIKENDAVRDKVVWERLELFDEKLRQIDAEREKLHELEMNLLERERELEDRERQLDKAIEDVRAKKDLNQLKSQSALHTSFSEDSLRPSNSSVEHQLISISQKLAKLDHLDEVLSRMQHSISSSSGSRSPMKQSKRSASDIKAEMEKLQHVILDDKAQDKEREAANLKIDRLFVELASTDEYKQEIKRAQEEKARVNEPLNKEALQEMLQRYQEHGNDEDVMSRKKLYAALTLIGMDRDTILGKHQNDFNQFLLGDLALVELRAIRASLPAFRRDQKKQLEFVEAVDLKIEQLMKNPVKIPAKPKRVFPTLPLGGSGGNVARSPRTATISMGNLAAELMAKRKKVEEK